MTDIVEAFGLGLATRRPIAVLVWAFALFLVMGSSVARHSATAAASLITNEGGGSVGEWLVLRVLNTCAGCARWVVLLGTILLVCSIHVFPLIALFVGSMYAIAYKVTTGARIELLLWQGGPVLCLDTRPLIHVRHGVRHAAPPTTTVVAPVRVAPAS
jgi:hypothetical protein